MHFDPIYHTRVRLRGYYVPQNVFSAHGSDKGKVVKRLFPKYGKVVHAQLSHEYNLEQAFADISQAHAYAAKGKR